MPGNPGIPPILMPGGNPAPGTPGITKAVVLGLPGVCVCVSEVFDVPVWVPEEFDSALLVCVPDALVDGVAVVLKPDGTFILPTPEPLGNLANRALG